MSRVVLTVGALIVLVLPARADRIAPVELPAERALRSAVVVVGTVTAVEKDAVSTPLYPGATVKVGHQIAVVKVETDLAGAAGATHLKVGFVTHDAAAAAGIRAGRGPNNPELKAGQRWLFFLVKHHAEPFHAIPYLTPPIPDTANEYKAAVAGAERATKAVTDPAKALKAEKAEDRAFAAAAIVFKLRTPPAEATKGTEAVPLTADESRPILKALAEGAWQDDRGRSLNGYRSFVLLGLTDADGWKPPAAEAGKDYVETTRTAFAAWVDGAGKGYRIKKLVPKK